MDTRHYKQAKQKPEWEKMKSEFKIYDHLSEEIKEKHKNEWQILEKNLENSFGNWFFIMIFIFIVLVLSFELIGEKFDMYEKVKKDKTKES